MLKKTGRIKSIRRKLFNAYGVLMISTIIIFFGLNMLITTQLKTQGIDSLIEFSIDGIFNNLQSLINSSVNQYLILENESLISLSRSYSDFADDGYISEDEAKKRVLDIIGERKVGESGYSYVVSYDGIMLQHPIKDFIGKDYSDGRGFPRMADMESGFIEYRHENPGDDESRSKIMYMDRFEPWGWIIATSAYEKDPEISRIRLEEAAAFIKSRKLKNIECISILDSSCEFLIPPEKDNRYPELFRTVLKPRLEDMKAADIGHIPVEVDNGGIFPMKAIVFFKYVPVLDWMIIAGGSRKDLYAPVINAYSLQLFAIIASLLVLFLLNRLLSKRLTAPLNELVGVLDRNSGGDVPEPADIRTGDEFETLGLHFNNFLERQQKYLGDISEAQKSIRILAKFPDENPNPVIRLSRSGVIEYANRVAVTDILAGYGLQTGDVMPDELLSGLTNVKALTGRNEFSSGEKVFAFSSTVISEHEGSYLFGRDITRQKKYESLQLLSENIFQNSIEGIVITDGDGRIESVNPAFTSITEYTEEDVIGRNPRILKSHRHSPEFYNSMWNELKQNGYWEGEIWNRKKSGEIYPEYLTINSVRDEAGKVVQFISFFHDLSDVKDREEKIIFEATHDQLTGLPNRIYLGQSLADFIADAQNPETRIAIVYMDINNLKRINESIGPESGDRLLIDVAARMSGLVDPTDAVVRLGSDEFAFVFHNTDKTGVTGKIDSIAESFKKAFTIKGREINIDVGFGVSFFPDDGSDPMELVANAERAMIQAKKDVNSIYAFYSPNFKKEGLSRLAIETGLKAAFEKGEFYLNYQPKVSVATGKIVGAEALVRVRPIEGQLIGPDVFIPVAEEIGLIEPLGSWVLEQACSDTKSLIGEGFADFTVAVNLSPWQFRKAELPQTVSNIIRSSDIPAKNLNLEITESMAIDNVEDSIQMMHKLTDIGLILSIDDFGTGYSSLSYLSQFPVNILKIDKLFVVGIPDDPKKVGVVQAILSLAENLGMETVAEGVETEEHFNFLRDRGCQQIQGFYFFRPMPITEIREILKIR